MLLDLRSLYEPSSVSGSGGVTFAAPGLASSGTLQFIASGGETIALAGPAGSGELTFLASGGETFTAPQLSGSGAEQFIGTGAITITALALSASGGEVFGGSGAVTFGALALDASGAEAFTGGATVSFTVAALDASGIETFAGSATFALAVPGIDAAGVGGPPLDIDGAADVQIAVAAIVALGNIPAIEQPPPPDFGIFGGSLWYARRKKKPEPAYVKPVEPQRIFGAAATSFARPRLAGVGAVNHPDLQGGTQESHWDFLEREDAELLELELV